MDKSVIAIINGPNLNLIGIRQPEIYGNIGFEEYIPQLQQEFKQYKILYFQSNHEGTIIDLLHTHGFASIGIILNAGAYTHTSIAIADAIASIACPVVEVHLSDIYNREEFRKTNFIKELCHTSFVGLGMEGYKLAIKHLAAL